MKVKRKGLNFQKGLLRDKDIEQKNIDIRDRDAVDDCIRAGAFDLIANCAAQVLLRVQ